MISKNKKIFHRITKVKQSSYERRVSGNFSIMRMEKFMFFCTGCVNRISKLYQR